RPGDSRGSRLADRHVVAFLASARLPLAHRIERWVPDAAQSELRRVEAFSELHGGRSSGIAQLPLSSTGSSLVKALQRGVPVINDFPADEPGSPAAAAVGIGATALVAIPVVWEDAVVEVVALYL
ncbi:hypothetical protein, partial [Methylibium sp. T29]|uniref:hypothetical protein n=1 Tax=Methylibium sp. T29 TaxID=1430884 RepID=UPI00055A5765